LQNKGKGRQKRAFAQQAEIQAEALENAMTGTK
jgi:hypothetical protein